MDNTSCIAVVGASGMVGNAITRNLINSNYPTKIATYNKNNITFDSNAVKTYSLMPQTKMRLNVFLKNIIQSMYF